MHRTYNVYHNLGYWFLLLIVLAFAGFYTSYLSVFFEPKAPVIHVHFTLMALWMGMLTAQPFLIKYKKRNIHRMLGKISYVLVPLVLVSGFMMIRHSYYRDISRLRAEASMGLNHLSNGQIVQQVAAGMSLPFIWFFWFILFYSLGIMNRRKPAVHARYMLATALSLLGPIVDRIVFKFERFTPGIRLEAVAFLIADISIAVLLLKDFRNKRPAQTLIISLVLFIVAQALYFTVPRTEGWQQVVALMMKPAP